MPVTAQQWHSKQGAVYQICIKAIGQVASKAVHLVIISGLNYVCCFLVAITFLHTSSPDFNPYVEY